MVTTPEETTPEPAPQPAAAPAEPAPEQRPEAGGSYIRLPDGTLEPTHHYED